MVWYGMVWYGMVGLYPSITMCRVLIPTCLMSNTAIIIECHGAGLPCQLRSLRPPRQAALRGRLRVRHALLRGWLHALPPQAGQQSWPARRRCRSCRFTLLLPTAVGPACPCTTVTTVVRVTSLGCGDIGRSQQAWAQTTGARGKVRCV
jgi:hypothetical protein